MFKLLFEEKRIIITLVLIIVTAIVISIIHSINELAYEKDIYKKEALQTLQILEKTISNSFEKDYERSEDLIDIILADKEVIKLFKSRDREGLRKLLLSRYEKIKDNYFQFQFHLPPAISFLRLQKTERYGDDLSEFRKTVVFANATKKTIKGLEEGRTGLGLRLVKPIFVGNEHIGSVELGKILDKELLHELKNFSGGYYYIYLNKKVENVSWENLSDIIDKVGPKDTFNVPKKLLKKCLRGDNVTYISDNNLILLIPIFDYNEKVKAYIKAVFPRKGVVEKLYEKQFFSLMTHILVIILFILFVYYYLNRVIIQKLKLQNQKLEQLNTVLQLSEAKLKELNVQKDRFISSVSHELRTPMNAIIGFTDIMLGCYYGEINDKQKDYLTLIKKSSSHLLDLINDILQIAKIDAGAQQLNIQMVNIKDFIEDIFYFMLPQFDKKGITFTYEIKGEAGFVEADRRMLKQIMLNLLSNALKYTQKDEYVKVIISTKQQQIIVEVIDNGLGIKEEDKEKLFTEFFQSDEAYKKALGGTGIGLALTKKLVKIHNGTIGYRPNKEKGSVFWFTMSRKSEVK